jgi:hypothetical protein
MQILIGACPYCVVSVCFYTSAHIISFVSVSVLSLFLASVCRVNYDPSAGIDSDCSDVAGDLPGIHQQPEGVPIVSKGAVTAEVSLYWSTVIA